MFEAFDKALTVDSKAPGGEVAVVNEVGDPGLAILLRTRGGTSYGRGLYRIVTPSDVRIWNARLGQAFPAFAERVTCFAYDWLGRAFTLDSGRREGAYSGVALFEPGTGEVLEIPCDLVGFHDRELVEHREAALAESFFRQWLAAGGGAPAYNQCAGYKVPLFLGGKDRVDNLELSDIDVYWTPTAHLIQAARRARPGSPLGPLSIDD